jgi:hypothetical protein
LENPFLGSECYVGSAAKSVTFNLTTGCGGVFSFLIDPLIDSKIGLPSADGHNTAIQNNDQGGDDGRGDQQRIAAPRRVERR